MTETRKLREWLALGALVIVTALVYLQVARFEFLSFDDQTYVYKNPAVLKGFSLEGVRWAFTHGVSGHWHPLSMMTHMLDVSVWGVGYPGGHHLTNLALHLANIVLLYLLVRRLLGNHLQSLLVAALFALHPIHVESVAWVAIRKDVLSQFFGLLALIVYVDYARHHNIVRYLLVILLFSLGLMSKAILVTLPASMLLLDFWPLRRFEETAPPDPLASPISRLSPRRIAMCCLEKIPLFILSAIDSWLTVHFMTEGNVLSDMAQLPAKLRLQNALISYIIYLRKLFFPFDLGVQYTYPQSIPLWQWGGALFLLLLITCWAISQLKKRPWFLIGWLWFLGTLVPVSGLMQAGMQPMADRY
ncbi:MAG: glycosyltransferase family 39 protein, partial [Thaumarchaeota archaeon]|nr:glycosyltransferase family 39 protein [Nitrososphaerota archaeon]